MLDLLKIKNNQEPRDRWVQKKLESLPNGYKILDAGCGPQRYRRHCKHLQYYSQDFEGYNPGGDGKNLQIEDWNYGEIDYKGDIWSIDEDSEKFDVILCTEVLEHVPFPNETIKELARLLKVGGIMIITAPFSSSPHMTPYYFYSGFHENWYLMIAKKNNLKVSEISENGNIYNFIGQELNRVANIQENSFIRFLLKIYFRFFSISILNLMSRYGKKQSLLPFGYHVVMKKRL